MRCDRFDGFPCLVDGKADAHVLLRAPGARAPERHAAHARARSSGSRPTRAARRSPASSSTATASRETLQRRRRRRLLRRGQLGGAAAALGERRATRTGSANSLGRRRPPLHGAHQLGRDRDLAGRRTRRSSRRRSASTTTTGAPTTPSSRSATSRCSARATATSCAPARRGSRPGSRSTTWPGTRSTSGSPPRTCRTPTTASPSTATGRIHLAKTDHNLEGRTGGCSRKLKGLLGAARLPRAADPALARCCDQRIPLAGVAHQCGTVRFGDDPATSALDVNCKAHDLDNLYVVDTSFFPSSSAVNPALTAMANALRVGDHLIERLGAPQRADDGSRAARRWRHEGPRHARQQRSARAWSPAFAGTAAMTVSSTLEAQAARPRGVSTAPARATAKALGIEEFDDDVAQARFSDLVALGLRHRLGRRARAARRDRAARCEGRPPPTAPRSGAARRSRCPRSTSRRRSCSGGSEEIAIDVFHHAVYAARDRDRLRARRAAGRRNGGPLTTVRLPARGPGLR